MGVEEVKRIIPALVKEDIIELLKQGKRLDGRGFLEMRKLTVIPGVISKAEGSALVMLGNTKVLAGVKLSLGKPFPDTPNEGVLVVNAELYPVGSPFWELGPSPWATELARVVDRILRSSHAIALDQLVIQPGELCWVVNIDIYPLDDDGNLIDASLYAAVAALLTTQLPTVDMSSGKPEIKRDRPAGALPLRDIPISFTFARVVDYLVLDPTKREECLMSARLTLGITSSGEICTAQKMGAGSLRWDDVMRAKDTALRLAREVRRELQTQVANAPRGDEAWKHLHELFSAR